jgi:hypothetical protein
MDVSSLFQCDVVAAAAAIGVKAKRVGDYWIFDYDQIKADWGHPTTWWCRGLVTDAAGNVVCACMRKFFNLGEGRAEPLDWSTAVVYDKLDGTMLNRWWHAGAWRYSTRFNLGDGLDLPVKGVAGACGALTWRQLIDQCLASVAHILGAQPRTETWTFEICSTANRVVVEYAQPCAWLVSRRVTATGRELDIDCFGDAACPRRHLTDAPDAAAVRAVAEERPGLECEGVVVFDGRTRAKVKNTLYVKLHHLRSGATPKNLAAAWLAGETSEITAYFPDCAAQLRAMDAAVADAQATVTAFLAQHGARKGREYAAAVKAVPDTGLHALLFKRAAGVRAWLSGLPQQTGVRWLLAHVQTPDSEQ